MTTKTNTLTSKMIDEKNSELRTVKTRDQATAILRKMGVAKADYSRFIVQLGKNGKFEVDCWNARHHKAEEDVALLKTIDRETGRGVSLAGGAVTKAFETPVKEQATVTMGDGKKINIQVHEPVKPLKKAVEDVAEASAQEALRRAAERGEAKAKAAAEKTAEKKAAKKTSARKNGKPTVANAIRELVRAGKDNDAIWAKIQPQFKLSDDKKWYPGWYRAEMIRKNIA